MLRLLSRRMAPATAAAKSGIQTVELALYSCVIIFFVFMLIESKEKLKPPMLFVQYLTKPLHAPIIQCIVHVGTERDRRELEHILHARRLLSRLTGFRDEADA